MLLTIPSNAAGLYSLLFARCPLSSSLTTSSSSSSSHHVSAMLSFHLQASFYNPGPNYLSAGDTPLPLLYFSFFLLFLLISILWMTVICRASRANSNASVHQIHHMMSVLTILKTISLFFESIRFHFLSLTGTSDFWSVLYYIFAALKGIMLFVVILLIGSGWSLMRPFLNDREKRIILAVLILQVIDNVAIIMVAETAPGSIGWLTWRDVLHLVDILCCCAILFPIVWSIRHLRYTPLLLFSFFFVALLFVLRSLLFFSILILFFLSFPSSCSFHSSLCRSPYSSFVFRSCLLL